MYFNHILSPSLTHPRSAHLSIPQHHVLSITPSPLLLKKHKKGKRSKETKENQKDNNDKWYQNKAKHKKHLQMESAMCGPTIPRHGSCSGVWLIYSVRLVGKGWFSITKQVLIANNLWVMDDTLCLPLLHCLVWTCARLRHTVAATVNLYLNQPYCIWEMLLKSTLCFWDSNKTTFSPSLQHISKYNLISLYIKKSECWHSYGYSKTIEFVLQLCFDTFHYSVLYMSCK